MRPADIIIISESQAFPCPNGHDLVWLWRSEPAGALVLSGVFAHSAGKMANFVFYDGHVKSKKWLSTLYPVNQNNWVLSPDPEPEQSADQRLAGMQGERRLAT